MLCIVLLWAVMCSTVHSAGEIWGTAAFAPYLRIWSLRTMTLTQTQFTMFINHIVTQDNKS